MVSICTNKCPAQKVAGRIWIFYSLPCSQTNEQMKKKKKYAKDSWTDKVSSPNCVCYFESILIAVDGSPAIRSAHKQIPLKIVQRTWYLDTETFCLKTLSLPTTDVTNPRKTFNPVQKKVYGSTTKQVFRCHFTHGRCGLW